MEAAMANAYIREYAGMAVQAAGMGIQAPQEPALATQTVSFTTTTQSAALHANTKLVLVTADAAHNMVAGASPSATATDYPLFTADTERFFGVKGGDKLSFYDGSS